VGHEGEEQLGGRMRLVALRGQVVTDYEVWPDGTVLFEDSSVATTARP
jgi:hypothetical protein